jgi:hypothetical protein
MMTKAQDGAWLLFSQWCSRNGGTAFRAPDGEHVCSVGPVDQTISPGDPGTVDLVNTPPGSHPDFNHDRLDLVLKAAELKLQEAELDFRVIQSRVKFAKSKISKKIK